MLYKSIEGEANVSKNYGYWMNYKNRSLYNMIEFMSLHSTGTFLYSVVYMNHLCLDAACKSAEMTFKQLFDHLTLFVKSPDHRWRLCMRIKRGLIDPNDLGGYGKDQCYFEGMT